MSSKLWSSVAVGFLSACAGTPPALAPGSAAVELSPAAPPAGYVMLRPLTVVSGKGCGVMGTPGSAEGAQALLRSEAKKLGASYVRILSAEKPPINHQCQEHEHKLSGVAYRKAAPSTAPTPAAAPVLVQSYEPSAPISKPAAATDHSSIALALVPAEPSGSALSVQYLCTGADQRADLDVWSTPLVDDWSKARALSVRVKPSAAMSLSVSFMDGNHSGYTLQTETLVAGQWQTVRLPFDKFWLNPFGPPGDVQGAPQDRTRVAAFGFAPRGCNAGHFLIDDFALE